MMSKELFSVDSLANKEERYRNFLVYLRSILSCEDEEVSLYANTAAALREAFGFFWVGFYWVKGDRLVLGPFQGGVACTSIPKGRGVCGTAWQEERTLVVPDVDAFPGHIACSSLSRSEIVVPVFKQGKVISVLDIDSEHLSFFDDIDARNLEKVAELLAGNLLPAPPQYY